MLVRHRTLDFSNATPVSLLPAPTAESQVRSGGGGRKKGNLEAEEEYRQRRIRETTLMELEFIRSRVSTRVFTLLEPFRKLRSRAGRVGAIKLIRGLAQDLSRDADSIEKA